MGVAANDDGIQGDIFLAVKSASAGIISGEAQDAIHFKEIEVRAWSWGMAAKVVAGGGTVHTGKASVQDLRIVKGVDAASTALMWALRNNERILSAVLTVRKAGSKPLEFLKITLEDARVSTISIDGGVPPGSVGIVEVVTFVYNKIDISYFGQGKDGQSLGGRNFADSFGGNA